MKERLNTMTYLNKLIIVNISLMLFSVFIGGLRCIEKDL